MTLVAALLAAGITLPFVGIAGIASRDASNSFRNLTVGQLGQAPARSALYDSQGHAIAYFYPNNIYRVPITYNQIAPVMRNAIVAIEDSSFWHQGALDFRGTVRALTSTLGGGQTQGGSTLAQQYVKNVRLLLAKTPAEQQAVINETVSRKLVELRIAANVEHSMSLQNLLTAYLNVAYFSNQAWGIQVAAGRYFSEPASRLTLPQAALLAGIVQSPSAYNPVINPIDAKIRRNEVLHRMMGLHYITPAQATAAENSPITLKMSAAPLQTGCISPQAANAAYFCDYVKHVLANDYPSIWNQILYSAGGLKIYTTLNMRDQLAADRAVNNVLPRYSPTFNPNQDAGVEVLMQPGTGAVRAIAINRTFGGGVGQNEVNFAVNSNYGGGAGGVQTGSSSKIFTLITALKQGVPFGHKIKIVSPSTVGPYYDCRGNFAGNFNVTNSEGHTPPGGEIWPLYSATASSINVYFANLEKQVGLCQTVQTAVDMGMTRSDGRSLLKWDKALGTNGEPADDVTSFTLGSVAVSPMSMAAAYASVAARGWYCPPTVLTKIVVAATGQQLQLRPTHCHRAMSQGVADAANYILQAVLTQGTAGDRSIGRPAAAKTGTANGGYYAAFAGWTPTLAAFVSVFNPYSPTGSGAMIGPNACYRQFVIGFSGLSCPYQMYGDMAPGAIWEETFLSAQLGPPAGFPLPPSSFSREGPGNGGGQPVNPPKPKKGPKPPPKKH
jgi:membrane peptidoglycan carboxypeptidase